MDYSVKKWVLLIFAALLISMAACNKPTAKEVGVQKATAIDTTGGFGNDLNSTDNVEKDLSADQLDGVDSGLADIQNI